MISLVFTIIGAVASTVAAVTGLILLFQYVPDIIPSDILEQLRKMTGQSIDYLLGLDAQNSA